MSGLRLAGAPRVGETRKEAGYAADGAEVWFQVSIRVFQTLATAQLWICLVIRLCFADRQPN